MLKVNTRNSLVVVVSMACCYRHVPAGAGFKPERLRVINDIKGGVIPGEYIPAVDKGSRNS